MAQRISALVYFDGGSHGFEIDYDEDRTVDEYRAHFVAETLRANATKNVTVAYIKITEHEEDGSFKIDENGNRLYRFIYTQS